MNPKNVVRMLCACLLDVSAAHAATGLKVVATLSTFGDLIKTIGGDAVTVTSIASPKFNPHFIEPRPSDVLNVKRANVFAHAGLDLEAWRDPLVNAAGNTGIRPGSAGDLDLSRGIPLLEVPSANVSRAEGDIHVFGNPHYWVSPENGRIMAQTIAAKLSEMDPANQAKYEQNLAEFLSRLDPKIAEWKEKAKPLAGMELVGYHKSWPYLMDFLGTKMEQFLEPKPGIPPSPQQVDFLKNYMKANAIKVIVTSSYFSDKASQSLANDTGAKVLLLAQSVGETKEATDYIAMIDYDVNALIDALN